MARVDTMKSHKVVEYVFRKHDIESTGAEAVLECVPYDNERAPYTEAVKRYDANAVEQIAVFNREAITVRAGRGHQLLAEGTVIGEHNKNRNTLYQGTCNSLKKPI